jgi:hypothetical protein
VAYRLGAGQEDLDELRRAAIGEEACGFIRDTNLRYFCRSAFQGERLCSTITDARIQQICRQM